MLTFYGIKNCDTVKKARTWLDGRAIAYHFHDYKTAGITQEKLRAWVDEVGFEVLLNKAGTTFRALPECDKVDLDAEKAITLMVDQPSLIKRPVIEGGAALEVGFKPERYEVRFG